MKSGKDNPNYRYGQTTEFRREWNSWRAMKQRCEDQNYRAYHRYGGRGISYCERWKDFGNFLEDMGRRPEGKTLDRINNDEDYSPENCRWSDQKVQMHNSTKVSKAKVTSEQLAKAKCSMSVVYKRLRKGWDVEKALNTPAGSPYEALRIKYAGTHRHCPVCGELCRRKRDKYCCKEHFWQTRKMNGRFSKKVQSVEDCERKCQDERAEMDV